MKFFPPVVVLAARVIVGVILIYASLNKIGNPAAFSDLIDNYNFTPEMFSNLFALFIPWLEVILGICLITGWMIDGANLMAFLLMAFFIILISRALILGIDTHCGCFTTVVTDKNLDARAELFRRLWEDIGYLLLLGYVQIKLMFDKKGSK